MKVFLEKGGVYRISFFKNGEMFKKNKNRGYLKKDYICIDTHPTQKAGLGGVVNQIMHQVST